jgi:hypothetical protein
MLSCQKVYRTVLVFGLYIYYKCQYTLRLCNEDIALSLGHSYSNRNNSYCPQL